MKVTVSAKDAQQSYSPSVVKVASNDLTPLARRPDPVGSTPLARRDPRALLKAIPGVELRECGEATWCCGSAGIYNITQPETSAWLQERKLGHLRATGAEVVATANPGCHLQIENGLRAAGDKAEVAHPVVLLARAYREESAAKAC